LGRRPEQPGVQLALFSGKIVVMTAKTPDFSCDLTAFAIRVYNNRVAEVVNLTPHAISLANEAGEIIATFPPSGEVARLTTDSVEVGSLLGAPIKKTVYGEVSGVPDPQEGVVYLVSALVAQATKREDVVAPDTGPSAVRNADGQVVAVRGFITF